MKTVKPQSRIKSVENLVTPGEAAQLARRLPDANLINARKEHREATRANLHANKQRMETDRSNRLIALNKTIVQQNAELLEKDWQLFTARATALIAVLTTVFILYRWLAAPVIAMAGLECRL
ncbi:hypothetical protein [Methylomonas fluvii]|uniref:Uncharacterized protein n=1 Tax=Methylomonas fluvii TaxID=1854564 RepID=A0ABR9DJB7_9GAMM|nr:hypothetical protein [Methylomonas fluvii]MBD9362921.1 hypothetical protein [Methylomonas fluvii]